MRRSPRRFRLPTVATIWALLLVPTLAGCAQYDWDYHLRQGRFLSNTARYAEAERHLRTACELARHSTNDEWTQAVSLYYLGDLYYSDPSLEHSSEAVALFEESAKIWERLSGPDSPAIAAILVRLSDMAAESGDPKRAHELLRRTDVIMQKAFPPEHPVSLARDKGARPELGLHADELFELARRANRGKK
jgi:tetratricopeptide (TPR) repeat protein